MIPNDMIPNDTNTMTPEEQKKYERLTEQDRIGVAVDAFAERMKARMMDKYDAGYRGWDRNVPVSNLIFEVQVDAADLNGLDGKHIDIVNRVMMLDYRKLQKKSS